MKGSPVKNENINDADPKKKAVTLGSAFKDAGKTGGGVISFAGNLVGGVVKMAARTVLGPVSLIAGFIAWVKTPAFIGGAGVLKSLGVGAGTSIVGTLGTIAGLTAGILGGGAVGATLGGIFGRSKKAVAVGAIAGMGVFGIGGAIGGNIAGMIKGYDISKETILERFPTPLQDVAPATNSFNASAQKPSSVYVITAADFKKAPAVSAPALSPN